MGMVRASRFSVAVAVAVCAALISVTGCSQFIPGAPSPDENAQSLTIGSPAIAEGPLLAELYGQVLESHSYEIFYNFGFQSRKEAFEALQAGMIDFLPDFSGGVLDYLYPEAQFRSAFEVSAAARSELKAVGLTMLPPALAENGVSFVATREFVGANEIASIGQLASIATRVTIGAGPGFETGASGRANLKRIYAVTGWDYLAIPAGDDQLAVDALSTGAAQIVVMRASSALIKLNDLVIIADPSHALPSDNLIPIMKSAAYPRAVEKLLDGVSQALTTEQLRTLSARRTGDNPPSDWRIARDWLEQNKLLGPDAPQS